MSMVLTGTSSREDHISNLRHTSGACRSNLYHRLWVIVIREFAAGAHDNRPCFANDLGASRNRNGIGDDVYTRVKEDDLASGELNI